MESTEVRGLFKVILLVCVRKGNWNSYFAYSSPVGCRRPVLDWRALVPSP